MTIPTADPQARLRQTVYFLLITLSTGTMLGRIAAVDSVDKLAIQKHRIDEITDQLARKKQDLQAKGVEGPRLERALRKAEEDLQKRAQLRRPFLSANDRSRWCAVRALVEEEMRVQGAPYAIDKVINERGWDTIDMVKHDGHLYSSKPTLLPTLLAGPYWVIHRLTGATLQTHPYVIGRSMIAAVNVISLVIYFLVLVRLVERFGTSDWGRVFAIGAATFGTFLTTFAVAINNHLPAALGTVVTLYAAVRIWFDNERRLRYFVIAGLFAGFTASNELPALALFAMLTVVLLYKSPTRTLLGFAPAALLVAAGFFGTNWIAHHSLLPPYAHRSLENPDDNWYDYTYQCDGKEHESYWRNRAGLDRGEESAARYALHVLVGHHGIFSLTPVWLLSVAGLVMWLVKPADGRLRELALVIGTVSLVCLIFYLLRDQCDRNYGGMTSGFRWMFWFAPLWLVVMLPAADAMARRRWTRFVALLLLATSVFSASYPTWNPWTHPWAVNFLQYLGWVEI